PSPRPHDPAKGWPHDPANWQFRYSVEGMRAPLHALRPGDAIVRREGDVNTPFGAVRIRHGLLIGNADPMGDGIVGNRHLARGVALRIRANAVDRLCRPPGACAPVPLREIDLRRARHSRAGQLVHVSDHRRSVLVDSDSYLVAIAVRRGALARPLNRRETG